jgi:hypothetical protein
MDGFTEEQLWVKVRAIEARHAEGVRNGWTGRDLEFWTGRRQAYIDLIQELWLRRELQS